MTRHRNSLHPPSLDSPSKQLILDLARDLEQVRFFNDDLKKVHAYERRVFYENLDRVDQERQAVDYAALDQVAAFHERLRAEAEALLEEHNRAEGEERRRKEEEARKERERIERKQAEQARREQEEAARLEAERKAKEEAVKKAKEEADRKQQAAKEEKERREREGREKAEAEKKKQEEDAKRSQQEAEQKALAQKQKQAGASLLTPADLRAQERYVEIHKSLKDFRKWLQDIGKQNPSIKQAMGDMRRAIKKSVGQLRDGKGANKPQTQQIRMELEKALTMAEPSVDIKQFIAFPPDEIANSENKVPALLIYGFNMFSKALVSVLINEASIKPEHAEPIGIVAAQIFSMDVFVFKGIHMSDILWAKYRVVCPALWGFTGNEKTEAGRKALGWWREEPGGPFVNEQTHLDRMTALGAGYAALTLRNFGKTQRRNPFPNNMLWKTLTTLLAIPPAELQNTQITLLYTMLRSSGERIVGFWGQYGLLLLRRAVVELPAKLARNTILVTQLKVLRDTYKRDLNLAI